MLITLTHIDTACVLLDINGYRIMVDPTLDRAGHLYYHGFGAVSRKTGNPAIKRSQLPPVDMVLLTHHQHKDNFDHEGRRYTSQIPLVFSTRAAAKAIPGIIGLSDWESREVATTLVPGLKITATPAQHHPWWIPGFVSGSVIGFIVETSIASNVIYITGDTVFFRGIVDVAKRFRVSTAIIHAGSVQFRYLTGFGKYTMGGRDLLRTARCLQPQRIIPVHFDGWTHFKEKKAVLRRVIESDEQICKKTIFPEAGIPMVIS
ncbi:MAG: MBL fold metallo-hydrolase [Chitinophagaceae bacterium]